MAYEEVKVELVDERGKSVTSVMQQQEFKVDERLYQVALQ